MPALSRAIAVLTDPAECGPVTLAFCQDVQTEAYDYPASFFDERVHRLRRIAPDPREIEEAAAILKTSEEAVRGLRRRRPLLRRRAGADRLLRQARNSGRRDAGGQVGDAGRSSFGHGRGRRHRNRRGQRARLASRRDRRRRHAVRRLHHRLLGLVQEPRSAIDQRQRPVLRCGQASGFVCRRRRADGACRARFQARRLEGAARLERRSREGQGRMGSDRRPLHRADQRAGADRRRSARRAHARGREVGRRRLRLWRTAGRIAQAVAGGRAARLPSRIRLFVHGLRDRRRDRRQDGSAGPGSCWWCSATARIS